MATALSCSESKYLALGIYGSHRFCRWLQSAGAALIGDALCLRSPGLSCGDADAPRHRTHGLSFSPMHVRRRALGAIRNWILFFCAVSGAPGTGAQDLCAIYLCGRFFMAHRPSDPVVDATLLVRTIYFSAQSLFFDVPGNKMKPASSLCLFDQEDAEPNK